MPTTAWIKAQSVTGTGWTPSGAASLILALAVANDGQVAIHADPATDKLKCLDYDFAGEGIISTDVIELIEFQCYGTTGNPHIDTGATIGVRYTLDGSAAVGTEDEFVCDGPGMQNDILTFVPSGLTGADILTATFGFLVAQGSNSAGSPTYGRQVDFERARITYSAGTVTGPVAVLLEDIDYIPGIGISRTNDMARRS